MLAAKIVRGQGVKTNYHYTCSVAADFGAHIENCAALCYAQNNKDWNMLGLFDELLFILEFSPCENCEEGQQDRSSRSMELSDMNEYVFISYKSEQKTSL